MSAIHEQVDRLLHDADRAHRGVVFVGQMARRQPFAKHHTAQRELVRERDRLIREALALDPERSALAWTEVPDLTEYIEDQRFLLEKKEAND